MTTCCSQEGEILYQLQSLHKVIGAKFEACTGISQSRLELLAVLFHVDEISQSDLQKKVNIDGAAVTQEDGSPRTTESYLSGLLNRGGRELRLPKKRRSVS